MRVVCAAFVLLLLPLASAGDASSPEVTDPAEDWVNYNSRNSGCVTSGHAVQNLYQDYSGIDIVKAWISSSLEVADVTVGIETVGDIEGDFIVDVVATLTDDTIYGSVATEEGTPIRIRDNAGTYSGVEGGSASASGNVLTFTVPKAAMGLTGGEVLDLVITAQRPGDAHAPAVCMDGSGGRDTAGPGEAFVLPRAPQAPGIDINVTDAMYGGQAAEGTVFETTGDVAFTASLNITNTGTDLDNITISADIPDGFTVDYNETPVELAPGASHVVNVTVGASGLGPGSHDVVFVATSSFDLVEQVTFSFSLPAEGSDVGQETGTDDVVGNGTGNQTEDALGDSDDQESPGLALPLLVLALIAVVRRR